MTRLAMPEELLATFERLDLVAPVEWGARSNRHNGIRRLVVEPSRG